MPLLYYSTHAMLAAGADVVQVKYDYTQTHNRQASTLTERFSLMKADVIQMAQLALQQREYNRLTIIGKSLGTLAIPYLLGADLPVQPQTCIFLTPILKELQAVLEFFQQFLHTLFVIGTQDPYYDPDLIAKFRITDPDNFLIITGANHSLEVPGDIERSLEILDQVTLRIKGFFHSIE